MAVKPATIRAPRTTDNAAEQVASNARLDNILARRCGIGRSLAVRNVGGKRGEWYASIE
jgi:hypothetical protein